MKVENMNVASGATVNIISESEVTINHGNIPQVVNKEKEQITLQSTDIIEPAEVIEPVKVIDDDYQELLEKGKPYFDNAINEGYLVANGFNYQWKKSKVLLAYFCGKIYCGDYIKNNTWKAGQEGFFPDKQLSMLFKCPDLGASRRKKLMDNAPIGYKLIERLFD